MLGIGGGGDVFGALTVGRRCEELGTQFVLGGVAWERLPIDPYPGPRSVAQIHRGEPLGRHAVLAGAETATPEGVLFSESHAAAHLQRPTVLIDITDGPSGAAEGIRAAAGLLGCDFVVFADVGGDALAVGTEPGLGSPLCDAVMLAAAGELAPALDGAIAVLGAACDGELTIDEVLGRVAALASAGAWIGSSSVTRALADDLEAAATSTGTEASMQVVRCARGETGEAPIRGGRRTVPLGPVGAVTFYFDVEAALAELPLARAVAEASDLEASRRALNAIGVATELDYEREHAGQS